MLQEERKAGMKRVQKNHFLLHQMTWEVDHQQQLPGIYLYRSAKCMTAVS
jgi:hypothetical protein